MSTPARRALPTPLVLASLGLLLLGCPTDDKPDETGVPSDLVATATLSETVSTVVLVDWESPSPGESWVEYGTDSTYSRSTPHSAAGETVHHFALLGLPPLSTVWWRATTVTDQGTLTATGQIDTLNLPSEVPDISVEVSTPEKQSSEAWFLGNLQSLTSAWIFIADREGNRVWYWPVEGEQSESPMSGSVGILQGTNDILYLMGCWSSDPGYCGIHHVTMEGEVQEQVAIPDAHHSFTQLPDGTLAALVLDIRPWLDEELGVQVQVYGDAIVEVAPDGTQTTTFSTWDWREVEKNDRWDLSPYGTNVGDWTHANSIQYNETNDTWLVSFGHLDLVAEIDRTTGEVLRTFGSEGIPTDALSTPMDFQHEAQWTPDGTLLLTSLGGRRDEVLGVEYEVTDEALHEVWSCGKGSGLESRAGGQAIRLANGNTLFNAGTSGTVQEITPEGEVVWQMVTALGGVITWLAPLEDLYAGE